MHRGKDGFGWATYVTKELSLTRLCLGDRSAQVFACTRSLQQQAKAMFEDDRRWLLDEPDRMRHLRE